MCFFLQNFGDVKNEVFKKENCIFCFCLFLLERERERETEKGKNKMEKAQKPIKIGVLKVVIQKCEQKDFFAKID